MMGEVKSVASTLSPALSSFISTVPTAAGSMTVGSTWITETERSAYSDSWLSDQDYESRATEEEESGNEASVTGTIYVGRAEDEEAAEEAKEETRRRKDQEERKKLEDDIRAHFGLASLGGLRFTTEGDRAEDWRTVRSEERALETNETKGAEDPLHLEEQEQALKRVEQYDVRVLEHCIRDLTNEKARVHQNEIDEAFRHWNTIPPVGRLRLLQDKEFQTLQDKIEELHSLTVNGDFTGTLGRWIRQVNHLP